MKKICIFTQSLVAAGAEKQVVLLAKAMSIDHIVHIVVYRGSDCSRGNLDLLSKLNVKLSLLFGSHISKISQLYRIFSKNKFDIVFNYLLFPNIIGGILSKITDVGYSIGGIRSSFLEKRKVLPNKFAHNFLNHITIFNNYLGYNKYTLLGFNKNKAHVIPNCIEINIPMIIRNSKNNNIKILSVGRFHFAKDYITALRSILILNNHSYNFKYLIVGYGEEESRIRQFVKANHMNNYVKIIIKPDNLDEIYKDSDIYLQTSIFEGLSNTIMEAMSYSLPIIATNVGDNPYLIQNNENGFLCEPKNIQEICEKLMILFNSPDLCAEFGKRNYSKIKKEYNLEIFKEKYQKFIDNLYL